MKIRFSRPVNYCLIFLFIVGLGSFFFLKQNNYHTALPVEFQANQLPYINVEIEGISYPVLFDLGSRLELHFNSDFLKKLDKHPFLSEKWKNFEGRVFESPVYCLPKVKIGDLIFKDPSIVLFFDGSIDTKNSKIVGSLGRGLLKKVNLLIDIKKNQILLTNQISQLKKEGYNFQTFIKVPFELDPKGIIIEALTDLGRLRLLLDTGCTTTFLHSFFYPENLEKKKNRYGLLGYTTNQFNIQGVDFEPQDLSFIEMTEELRVIDGLLGMDFIKSHVMYIDFPKKTLYIQK